jgi:hypothetical protein
MATKVSPVKLTVRCVALRKGDQWQAFSLEFGLAAQSDSLVDLHLMIQDYWDDALVGEDRQHAVELLSRRAPWWVYVYYYLARIERLRGSMAVKKTFSDSWDPQRLCGA